MHLHDLHHAQDRRFQDSNYSGSTPIWDVLFGTFGHPIAARRIRSVSRTTRCRGFAAQVWFPFRSQLRPPRSLAPSS